tara:strand:+ start:53 stop:247 length:195 start_codon:yes stop_codon:yes gene_type:complete
MSENYFGRENDDKYKDLYASIMRIAEKSAEKEKEAKGFEHISSDQTLKNVQNAYKDMYNKKEEE